MATVYRNATSADDLNAHCPAAVGALMTISGVGARSGQLLQQGFGFLEVGGVKALGEPGMYRCEQFSRFVTFALLVPQAGQAHGRAEFQGLGLLAASHLARLLKTHFCCSVIIRRLN